MTGNRTPIYLHRHEATGTVMPSTWFSLGIGWVNLGRCFE